VPFTVYENIPPWWDVACGESRFQATRWWLVARGRLPEPIYTFAIRRGNQTTAALVGAVLAEPPARPSVDVAFFLRKIGSPGITAKGLYPALLLMHPQYECQPIGSRAADARLLDELLTSIWAWARERSIKSVSLAYVPVSTARTLLEAAAANGFISAQIEDNHVIDVTWKDSAGYQASLNRRQRQTMTRDLRMLAGAGAETVHGEAHTFDSARLCNLRLQNALKYGRPSNLAHERDLWNLYQELFAPSELIVFAVISSGKICSFTLYVRDGPTMRGALTGTDYGAGIPGGYFSTAFYAPAEYAAETGVQRLYLGIGASAAKLLRGARADPLFVAIRTEGGYE
jgi:predicted N-acyltransferase